MNTSELIISATGLGRDYVKTVKDEGLRGSLSSLMHKKTETIPALRDFELELGRGEMLGLIGPNGAGKTTLVKLLSGIMRPSSGELAVLGHSPRERRSDFLARIALVMGQKSQLWWDLPAIDSFLLSKAIYGIPESRFRKRLERLSSSLEVEQLLNAPVRSLSLGERMRMEFIAAMLHEPELAFLDEPTIGLDAIAQRAIRDFLRRENAERGMSIVLTSHYMGDIRLLCPRTALILKGRKSYDGPTAELFATAPDEGDVAEVVEKLYGGAV